LGNITQAFPKNTLNQGAVFPKSKTHLGYLGKKFWTGNCSKLTDFWTVWTICAKVLNNCAVHYKVLNKLTPYDRRLFKVLNRFWTGFW